MNRNKQLIGIILMGTLLCLILLLLMHFNLIFKVVTTDYAQITVNFLFPMKQDELKEHITLEEDFLYKDDYALTIEWLNEHTCTIYVKELGEIKGKNTTLIIEDAPTLYKGLEKSAKIDITFKTPLQIINTDDEMLITTEKPFYITFNTPVDADIIHQYSQSDASFYIEPMLVTDEKGKVYEDLTRFKFTPTEKLENNRTYILIFREGMPSKSGEFLEETIEITLTTDKAPEIKHIIPADQSKWIGLCPHIVIESDEPLSKAIIEVGGMQIDGIIKNTHYAHFYLPKILEPDTAYNLVAQVESLSGELSEKAHISFHTLPIAKDQIWLEIVLGDYHEMIIYQGEKEIKRVVCSGGTNDNPTPKGTYYLRTKGESYFDSTEKIGSNYAMILTEGITMHGMLRDENWQFIGTSLAQMGDGQTTGNIILNEEDAKWLYDTLPIDTLIVIR